MGKERLLEAREFQQYIKDNYQKDVYNSIENTKIYSDFNLNLDYTNKIDISVVGLDIASAIAENGNSGKLCVLNFASFKNPGGGYINGAMAQEEALCGVSTLYPVLSAFEDKFYKFNRKNMNNGMYLNRALYSKDIFFTSKVTADVLTCAAPNLSSALRYNNKEVLDGNNKVVKSRIRFVIDIALDNNVDTIILGAFGCGVFKQDAKEVAKAFQSVLVKDGKMLSFKKVIFAIPTFNAMSTSNYNDFVSVFG